MASRPDDLDRVRLGWWLVGLAVLGIVVLFVYSFVGTVVLGLFIYYGARPMHRRVCRLVPGRGASATLTMLLIVLPTVGLLIYAGTVAFQQFMAVADPEFTDEVVERLPGDAGSVSELVEDPQQILENVGDPGAILGQVDAAFQTFGAISTGLLHLTLALVIAFFLFRDGHRLAAWFRADVGDAGSVPYAFLSAIDADLETVYFGNVLTVGAVTVLSVIVYHGLAFVSPPEITVPVPTLLAVLTGLATFIPIVVGKIVYVPVAAYLFVRAFQAGTELLWFPTTFLVASFLLLDLLPQSVLQPYVSGRRLHMGIVMLAYVLGAALFGWYGLFLGPLLLVVVVQFVAVVLPELLHGREFTPYSSAAVAIGSPPVTGDGRDGSAPSAADNGEDGDAADGGEDSNHPGVPGDSTDAGADRPDE